MKNAILESFDGNIWNQMFVKSMEKKKNANWLFLWLTYHIIHNFFKYN